LPISNVKFTEGSLWEKSLVAAAKDTPNIVSKIAEFIKFKEQNPLTPFGNNDKQFTSGGVFKLAMPKARKAHLTSDISIIYELSGKNPIIIKLYGVFTHAELGTGQPPNLKIQKNMAKKLAVSEDDGSL
jgi:mRNA-degrading endonuclease YafQ of YafQ-DinJ toxin-antitoxin module